jgi:hypothetical protein
MIKKSLTILSISAAYSLSAQDVSTLRNTVDVYSNSNITGSSKYNSMAGSMGALGGDFSVLNSNPAGIAVSIASEFSATLAFENSKNTSSFGGQSLNYKINDTDLGNVGGIASFQIDKDSPWKFVNIAVNYSNQSLEDYTEVGGNDNVVFEIKDDFGALIDQVSFAGHAYNRYGHLSKMSLGVGANYNNNLYFGAGLNFHNATLDQLDSAAFTDYTGGTSVYKKQYTPFLETSDGFSATLGVIGKINPQFRLGAALETPTWWSIARVYDEYENPTDGTYSEYRKLSTPMKATLSAAFVPNKNFALNVDYTLGLTKAKYKVYGSAEADLNNFFSNNSNNFSELKVGGEYRVDAFRLRGGYSYAANPFDSVILQTISDLGTAGNQSYSDLILGKRNTFGLGIGYDFKAFYIDAAYQSISSRYTNPFLQGSETNNTGYFSDQYIVNSDASLVSNVKNVKDNFSLTLGWKF